MVTADTGAPREPGRRSHSEIQVARRYLSHGFLDAATRIFGRNVGHVAAADWALLAARFLERGRIAEAVQVCQTGGVPLPRQELLVLGDRHLRRKDIDAAIHYYELAEADNDRWAGLVDVMTRLPGRELQAIKLTQRHLAPAEAPAAALPLAASA